MSFLNSIITSIGQDASGRPSSATTTSKPAINVPLRTGPPGSSRPQSATNAAPPKRKAEDGSNIGQNKAPRLATGPSLAPPPSRSVTTSPVQKAGTQPPPKVSAYQGTMKSKTAQPVPSNARPATAKPPPATTGTTSKPAQQLAAPVPAKPVAKSGYLAMLEKAKAAQELAKTTGTIKHHKTEKLTRREKERAQAEAAAAAKSGRSVAGRPAKVAGVTGAVGRSRDGTPSDGKAAVAQKDRKPVDVGYKGTMRSQPVYRGTMQSGGSAALRKPAQRAPKRDEYARWSDVDEEDFDEEDDYESDASSDMEARIDEIDQEEEATTKLAKKEDEEALREENELKRQKLERKKKLERLEAAAAKRKKLY